MLGHGGDSGGHLVGQRELQQAALPQGRLQDLYQLHRVARRQPGHHLHKLLCKTVLQVRQLQHKEPGGRTEKQREHFYSLQTIQASVAPLACDCDSFALSSVFLL